MSSEDHVDRMRECAQLVQQFNRRDIRLGLSVGLFGCLCISLGVICSTLDNHLARSASLFVIFSGIFFVWVAVQLYRRARHSQNRMAHEDTPGSPFFTTSLELLEKFSARIRRTRDASAILLAIAVIGIVASCVISRLELAAGAWLTIALTTGLFICGANTYNFLLEIHHHELQRLLTR